MSTLDPKHASETVDESVGPDFSVWALGISLVALVFSLFTFIMALFLAAG